MKIRRIVELAMVSFAILFALVIICPIQDGLKGYEIIFQDYHLIIGYLSPIIACLLLLLKKYLKNIEMISIILFGVGAVFYLFHLISNEYANVFLILSIIVDLLFGLQLIYVMNVENEFKVRDIVEIAMLIALAIGLDLPGLKIRVGVNGGSISFTMVPLLILALRLGMFKGFIGAGIIYGAITSMLDGWGIQYYLFDYLLAYGSLAVLGLFSPIIFKKDANIWIRLGFLTIGIIIAVSFRLAFATLSGIIFYETPFVESLAYNALYILPSGGGALVMLLLLYKPLQVINDRFPVKSTTL